MSDFYVLDVGHGNGALLHEGTRAVVFDTPPGETVLRALTDLRVEEIDYIFLSHADNDHAGGAAALVSSKRFRLGFIVLNPDATKTGRGRRLLAVALDDAIKAGRLTPSVAFTGIPSPITWSDRVIEVVGPTYTRFLSGPGGRDVFGAAITSNGASIVLKLTRGAFSILLPGDMDESELEDLEAHDTDVTADVLVFPHHGGISSAAGPRFAQRLVAAVRPRTVIFSIGRSPHSHPDPDVVEGLVEAAPNIHIMCTQLSRHCSPSLPEKPPEHLLDIAARGTERGWCCAGSILLDESVAVGALPFEDHQRFIDTFVPAPLCRRSRR